MVGARCEASTGVEPSKREKRRPVDAFGQHSGPQTAPNLWQ